MRNWLKFLLATAILCAVGFWLAGNALADEAIPLKKAFPNEPDNPGDMLLDSGGPDQFGYIWIDSNEPDGPTFDWVDITGIGTPIPLSDDAVAGPFDLGFEFSFYGNTYTQFWVCSNGFGAVLPIPDPGGYIYWNNMPFPSPPAPGEVAGAAIAPFWDDMNPDNGGNVYYYANSDSFVVAWVGVPHYPNDGSYTYELILTADGHMKFQYLSLQGTANSATIGIQNEDGTIGLQVAYNQNYAEDGLAVELYVPAEEEVAYLENFDSGMGDWAGEWQLTSSESHSPPNSLTDSPFGNYNDYDTVVVEMTSDVDLSGYVGARLEFWTKYDLELGFDYVYLDISTDGGNNWLDFHTFNGEGVDWHNFVADLGGFAGQNIRFRFTLISDAAYNVDGMYIDDFTVFGLSTDTSPPLIIHEGPTDSTSVPEDYTAMATITDVSGVQSAWLTYSVDDGAPEVANPDSIVGDNYYFTIPAAEAGAHVNYVISATDNEGNTGDSQTYHYVSGTVLFYDDGEAEYIYQYGAGDKSATRFTPEEPAVLVTGMLRLYTDINRPLDTVDVQVWTSVNDTPGQPMINPMAIWPASTLEDPQAWTYVDFRGMNITVDSDFFLGYTYRSMWPVILGDSPARTDRSMAYTQGFWAPASTDYHIRAIVDYGMVGISDSDSEMPTHFALSQNYPNPFNAKTNIRFVLETDSEASIAIYNIAGQLVDRITGRFPAGENQITWDASKVASGVYFYRLTASGKTETRRMTLIK